MRLTYPIVFAHGLAAALALVFAWYVSGTSLVRSGMQFVGPLVPIVLLHLGWVLWTSRQAGYAALVLSRTAQTAVLLMLGLALLHLVAPMPSQASSGFLEGALVILFCLAVLAIVVALVALVFWLSYKGLRALFRGPGDRDKLNDLAVMTVVLAALVGASLEGVRGAYSFDGHGRAEAVREVTVPPEAVWAAMETATAPSFPLPAILSTFPRPVAVEVDEGTALGANRVVRFSGREGTGLLKLQVTERTARLVRLEGQSNSSPMGNWIGIEAISYHVEPSAAGTRLSVALDFDRKLSPAWAFGPMMQAMGWVAMDVLARDVALRAAGLGLEGA